MYLKLSNCVQKKPISSLNQNSDHKNFIKKELLNENIFKMGITHRTKSSEKNLTLSKIGSLKNINNNSTKKLPSKKAKFSFPSSPVTMRRNSTNYDSQIIYLKKIAEIENLEKDSHINSKKTIQLKVAARFRPLNEVEKELNKNSDNKIYEIISENTLSFNRQFNNLFFTFDRVFDINATQTEVYQTIGKETIEEVLKGYNGTIFVYGQSGSGKTYTMYGSDFNDSEGDGIVPRAVETIFDYIDDKNNKDIIFELKFSLLEIYKEKLYDLLNPNVHENNNYGEKTSLKIKESISKGIYVEGLTEEYISDIDEFFDILEEGEKYRVVSETYLNKYSSRSHLLLKLEIIQKFNDGIEKRGILNMVDLAGSEKVSKTGAVGETLEEAKKINLSLCALGNVISALSSNNENFVPYRDSKLTRILQDSLGGNFNTTLIVTCSPHAYNSEETLSTLNFAQRAKKIKTQIGMNIKRSPEILENIISQLNDELVTLKAKLMKFINSGNSPITLNKNNSNSLMDNREEESISPTNIFSINYHNHKDPDTDKYKSNNIEEYEFNIHSKDNEIAKLKNEIKELKQENKSLKQKLESYSVQKETKLIQELEKLVIYHVEELNKLKDKEILLLNENLLDENNFMKSMLERYRSSKNSEKEEDKLFSNQNKFFESDNVIDVTSKLKLFKLKFKVFEQEFKKLNHQIKDNENYFIIGNGVNNNSYENLITSYESIFNNNKLHMNKLLEDFLVNNSFDEIFITKEETLLKSAFIRLSLLNVSYEKIITDFLKRLSIDLKKFCILEVIQSNQENKLASMLNLMENYLAILNQVKTMKYLKHNRKDSYTFFSDEMNIINAGPVIKRNIVRQVRKKLSRNRLPNKEQINKQLSGNTNESSQYIIGKIENSVDKTNFIIQEKDKENEIDKESIIFSKNISIHKKRRYMTIKENHKKIDVSPFTADRNDNGKNFLDNAKYSSNNNFGILNEEVIPLKMIKNELNLYMNYCESLKSQISKYNLINWERENLTNNPLLFSSKEMDSFLKCVSVLKMFYEEELTNKNFKIELLSNTIDDILLNKGQILSETNLENSNAIKNYFEHKKTKIIANNNANQDILGVVESFMKESGSATKKLDYIYFYGDLNSENNVKIDFGSGLNSKYPGISPLQRQLKNTLKGDDSVEIMDYSNEDSD